MGKRARDRKAKKEILEKLVKEELKSRRKWSFDIIKFIKNPAVIITFLALVSIIIYPFYYQYHTKLEMNRKYEATLTTSFGSITIELFKKDAPKTVDNFIKLSNDGFYNGLLWHRIIKEFIIQTGDPNGDGSGGPGYQFDDEINDHKFTVGTVGMANSGANTNGSQFFIVTEKEQPSLDGKYTVFGQVISGMETVAKIAESPVDKNDKPISPVYLEKVVIK